MCLIEELFLGQKLLRLKKEISVHTLRFLRWLRYTVMVLAVSKAACQSYFLLSTGINVFLKIQTMSVYDWRVRKIKIVDQKH